MSDGLRRSYIWGLLAALLVGALLRGAWPTADPPTHATVGIVWHDEGAWVHNARNRALWGTGGPTSGTRCSSHQCSPGWSTARFACLAWAPGRRARSRRSPGCSPIVMLALGLAALGRAPRGSSSAPRLLATNLRLRHVESRRAHGIHHDGVHRRQLGGLRAGRAAPGRWGPRWSRGGPRVVHEGIRGLLRGRDRARRGLDTADLPRGTLDRRRSRLAAPSAAAVRGAVWTLAGVADRDDSRDRLCSFCRTGRNTVSTTGRCR